MTAAWEQSPAPRWIELGCGDQPNPQCQVHVDVRPGKFVDFTADLEEPLPIRSDEWDGVFCRYAWEHVSWRKIRGLIAETLRILKPGGTAVFITANLYEQCKMFVANEDAGTMEDRWICQIFGDLDYEANSHRMGASPQYALQLFQEAGFADVMVRPLPEWRGDQIIEARKGVA